jgi:amidohydrolase
MALTEKTYISPGENKLQQAYELQDQLVAWRRDFHMHPELGFQEVRTAGRVADVLNSLGYRVRTGVGRTGVAAERGEGHPVVAIRADMDALPIQEENDVPYASQTPGVMHACGHDAHTAIALGTATLLAGEQFPGTVRFLFQPAEEVGDDEGISGAPRMVEDGAMEGVDAVLALHVMPALSAGDIAVGPGPASAGVDTFYATIIGHGGHGAYPHQVVDPIYLSAYVILALHGIVSRRLHPIEPAVISIGSIHGGQADNVIPEQVHISGTLRFMDLQVQQQIHTEIERALEITRALGGDYEFRIEEGCPPMINHAQVVQVVQEAARDLIGEDHIFAPVRGMGAEDFGVFSSLAPGAMFALGSRAGDAADEPNLHHPQFDLDERCLPVGAAILAETALRLLRC